MNYSTGKILLITVLSVFYACSHVDNSQNREQKSEKSVKYWFDTIYDSVKKRLDTAFIKEEVLKQCEYEFSPGLSKMKIVHLLNLSDNSRIHVKERKQINCQMFDFKNFLPINPIINDSAKDVIRYKYDPSIVIAIKPSKGVFSDMDFYVGEKNGFRFIDMLSHSQQLRMDDSVGVFLNGFIFKELKDKNYYYISMIGPRKNRFLISIMLLNDSLYPVKQFTRLSLTNRFYNTNFIYKDGKVYCEISKPLGNLKLNENTTFGEIFKLFKTKVDEKNIKVLISEVQGDNFTSKPFWKYVQYYYHDSLLIH